MNARSQSSSALFEACAEITRAHARATVPRFEERLRLSKLRLTLATEADAKRSHAALLVREAEELDERAKRIREQMEVLR